jgi:hypothetical protein
MKFKHQLITACIVGFLLGGGASIARADDKPTWMQELPRVMCLKNQLWLVWVQSKYAVQVTGIFCTLTEDLV